MLYSCFQCRYHGRQPGEKIVGQMIEDHLTTTKSLPEALNPDVKEFRCVNCGRFLGLIALVEGTVCLKCKRCKIWSVVDVHSEALDTPPPEM